MDTFTLPSECPTTSFVNRTVDMADTRRHRTSEGLEEWAPYFHLDQHGIIRDPEGRPQTEPGSITPLGYVDLSEDAQTVMHSAWAACGLASAAWVAVGGSASVGDRGVALCLTRDACERLGDDELATAFGIAEHEVAAAERHVSERMADPEFASKFAAARAIMNAGCAYFPWYQGDGLIPG